MDPNANLQEQLERAALLLRLAEDEYFDMNDATEDVAYLAELVLALDDWLTKGGSLPARWKKGGGQ